MTVDVPPIRYAVSGDVHVEYQTWGDGPALVGVPPFVQNIEQLWHDPTDLYPAFLRDLGSFLTVTHFDKRGTGLSDRVPGFVGLEPRMEDFHAVMDHAGIERAVIGGVSEGGPLAMLHTGEIERRGDDVAGVAVHVAARVEALAGAGQVLATSTVRDLVLGSPFTFDEHGMHALKGVPGNEWRILSVR